MCRYTSRRRTSPVERNGCQELLCFLVLTGSSSREVFRLSTIKYFDLRLVGAPHLLRTKDQITPDSAGLKDGFSVIRGGRLDRTCAPLRAGLRYSGGTHLRCVFLLVPAEQSREPAHLRCCWFPVRVTGLFYFLNGAQDGKVREPREAIVVLEFEVWPEPKVLIPDDLLALLTRIGRSQRAADAIGASEAFVRQNAKAIKIRGQIKE